MTAPEQQVRELIARLRAVPPRRAAWQAPGGGLYVVLSADYPALARTALEFAAEQQPGPCPCPVHPRTTEPTPKGERPHFVTGLSIEPPAEPAPTPEPQQEAGKVLPRERLAQRWREINEDNAQLKRIADFLTGRAAEMRQGAEAAEAEVAELRGRLAAVIEAASTPGADQLPSNVWRHERAERAERELHELRERCKWATEELAPVVNDHAEGVVAVLRGERPIPGGASA